MKNWLEGSFDIKDLEASERTERWRLIIAFGVMAGAMIGVAFLLLCFS